MMRKTPIKAQPDDNLMELAESLRRAVGGFVRKTRAEAGTPSSARNETLALLEYCGPMTTTDLARHRGVKHQSMRLVIAELEKEALVTRSPSPGDGRSQLNMISATGCKILEQSRSARSAWIAGALACQLNHHEQQVLGEAAALLERLTQS